MQAKRLFVSLDLPRTVSSPLVRLNPQIPGVRWLAAEQIHLTLAFLGNVDAESEEKLRVQLSGIHFNAFFLPLREIRAFPARGHPGVLWVGVGRGHPHLFQLHKRVTAAALGAGLEPDLRPWRPHLTLARCRNVSTQSLHRFLREQADFDGGLVRIDSFRLKSSRPGAAASVYTTELAVPAAA